MTNAEKAIRLSKLAREFNVGISTLVDFLGKKGHKIESNPNTKVDANLYDILAKEFGGDINLKKESQKVSLMNLREKKESVSIEDIPAEGNEEDEGDATEEEVIVKNVTPEKESFQTDKPKINLTVKGKIDLEPKKAKEAEKPKAKEEAKPEPPKEKPAKAKDEKPPVEHIETEAQKLAKPKVVGKVDLDQEKKKIVKKSDRIKEKPAAQKESPKQDAK